MVEREGNYPWRQRLLIKEIRDQLPELYSGEEEGLEAKALVKFFTPSGNWTWYATEFDGEDLFFGLVVGLEIELGYFSLSELETAKGPLGLLIERDLHFEPRTLKELMEFHERERDEGADAVRNEATREAVDKLRRFAEKLAEWDQHISEIVGIGGLAKGLLAAEDTAQLVCTFDPEPQDQSQGFFSVVNLLVSDEFEHVSEKFGITNSIDLGFKMGPRVILPKGEIIDTPEDQIKLRPRDDERQHTG